MQLVSVLVARIAPSAEAATPSGGVSADGAVGERGRVVGAGPHAAAVLAGGVSADGAVGQRGRGVVVAEDAAAAAAVGTGGGGVSADGAVGQRGRGVVVAQDAAAAAIVAGVAAGDRQPRDRRGDIASTWNTRLCPPPLTVTPAFGPVIVSVPVVSLSSSWVPVR